MSDLIERLEAEADRRRGDPADPSSVSANDYEMQALLREAAAALEAAREDGWQPIETAPKDGTIIDMWTSRGARSLNVQWVVEPREGVRSPNCIMDGWKHPGDEPWGVLDAEQFTHWRPLPAPPAIDQARGKAGQEVGDG